jgi:hypothetical protein
MHARELVDVARIVALAAPQLIQCSRAPGAPHIVQYWAASKGRYENWSRTLKLCASPPLEEYPDQPAGVGLAPAVLEEIFTSEILTRVWTAVLAFCDRRAGTTVLEPIARSVWGTHLEARHRAMSILVSGQSLSTRLSAAINRLRRSAERISDFLLGGLVPFGRVEEFAAEPRRAMDFADDLAARREQPGGGDCWRLSLLPLGSTFRTSTAPPANPESNARIAASILGCFPEEMFDSCGTFRSLWLVRLATGVHDAQGLVSELLKPSTRGQHGDEISKLWRRN